MIPRYSRPEMTAVWTEEAKFQTWLDVEIAACQAMARIGNIPQDAADKIARNARFNVDRIAQIEAEVKHDVIAFVSSVAESLGDESRFVHLGLTSSDVIDTAFALQLRRAADILLADLQALADALKKRAIEHKHTVMVGRSHGIHAEPTTFGLKLAGFYTETTRNIVRLREARDIISFGTMSGAVGTYSNIDPRIEQYALEALALKAEPVATQVVPRDRHAQFFTTLALIASGIERLSTEVRHLQRSEVLEAEEQFTAGQKGSSAMPHKRNPILSENLTGLARLIRGYVVPALENVALWHERDISHSSVERVIAPDATIALDFALKRLTSVVANLVVYPEHMQRNLDRLNGLVFSQSVLLGLVEAGVARDDAYRIVQDSAMKVWQTGVPFVSLLTQDERVTRRMSIDQIKALFDANRFLKHVDMMFERVFSTPS